jgi:N-formylglutamate deformylase
MVAWLDARGDAEMKTIDNPIYTLRLGRAPLLVSLPHVGTQIPDALRTALVERALGVEDTDWFLDRLYAFVTDLGASLIVPRYSRYLIDLNRPFENSPMYSGVNNTELCPTRFFSGDPLYRDGAGPDAAEVSRRRELYWRPYHDALGGELARLKSEHGYAILFDAHSIKSELPWLFDGRLRDLNLGTAQGASCAATLRSALADVLQAQRAFTHVVDGRFKGGHITRHYGRPEQHVHAAQLEMCWSCYMREEPPWEVDPDRAARLHPVLESLVGAMLDWRPRV